MTPIAEIFSQGEELMTGQTQDTNAAWLSHELNQLGFFVKRHTTVGDHLNDLQQALLEIASRADCCICTGGLGPTQDDLTAQAIADAFSRPLAMDATALEQIQLFFTQRRRKMADSNRKQAMLPSGSQRIDNLWGTAPGFALTQARCRFYFMPGVPSEMKAMFAHTIVPDLVSRFELTPDSLVTLRTIGVGESDLQQKIQHVTLPDRVNLGFRTLADENQIKLRFPVDFDTDAISEVCQQLTALIGEAVFAIDGLTEKQGNLIQTIDAFMRRLNWRLSAAETISQGLIAAKSAGYSWLESSRFYASVETLAAQLDAQPQTSDLGQLAADCAARLQQQENTELSLVQLSDPSPMQTDPAATAVVYNALQAPDGLFQNHQILAGTPSRKQNQAALSALDLLRRYLQNKCL